MIAALAAAAILAGAAAPVAEAAMQPYFGAELQIDNLEGYHTRLHLAPDHTYTETGSDGPVAGTWALEDGKLCIAQKTPPPPPDRLPRYCNVGAGHKVGDKWRSTDPVTGNPIFFYLAPGP
jgi:hypothetical protein